MRGFQSSCFIGNRKIQTSWANAIGVKNDTLLQILRSSLSFSLWEDIKVFTMSYLELRLTHLYFILSFKHFNHPRQLQLLFRLPRWCCLSKMLAAEPESTDLNSLPHVPHCKDQIRICLTAFSDCWSRLISCQDHVNQAVRNIKEHEAKATLLWLTLFHTSAFLFFYAFSYYFFYVWFLPLT